jgi:HSP20 family protein
MTMIKLNNKYPFLFENFFNEADQLPKSNFAGLPAVNIIESKDDFQLEVAAPGLKKEDFQINLQNNKLTVSVEKKVESEGSSPKYSRKEFSYSHFQRSFSLPQTINNEGIEATYTDGILKIAIPKKEEAKIKEPKQIQVV